jgi:hypothetical protein
MLQGLHDPPLGESDTRSKLIDPAIIARGWTAEHIRREETAEAIKNINNEWRRRSRGLVDYSRRVKGGADAASGRAEAYHGDTPRRYQLIR